MKGKDKHYVTAYETGARYQLLHAAVLLATPSICGSSRAAKVSGLFLTTGMCLFCGSCYAVGITENREYGKAAPLGGVGLILGWLSLALLRK